jgi:hypothetical protein
MSELQILAKISCIHDSRGSRIHPGSGTENFATSFDGERGRSFRWMMVEHSYRGCPLVMGISRGMCGLFVFPPLNSSLPLEREQMLGVCSTFIAKRLEEAVCNGGVVRN